MDRIMSTSIILLDQNSNANDVNIWYLNLLSYSPTPVVGGGVELNTWSYYSIKIRKVNNSKSFQVKLIWKLI